MNDNTTGAPRASLWALVPAAGTGSRMGGARPKQYLPLLGRPVLGWSVRALAGHPRIAGVVVVCAPDDMLAATVLAGMPGVEVLPVGGATRRDSVLAGLDRLAVRAAPQDWVLVHDAARPGLPADALDRLIAAVADAADGLGDPVGGLLALPVADTVKRADPVAAPGGERSGETVPREALWLAQTPQMFRLRALREALRAMPSATDEASAIEAAGGRPRLVEGARENLKLTHPADLPVLEAMLRARHAGGVRASA